MTDTSEDMVRRVARVIDPTPFDTVDHGLPDRRSDAVRRKRAYSLARAVLAEARSPTIKMVRAGLQETPLGQGSINQVRDCFTAMIDAAMEES